MSHSAKRRRARLSATRGNPARRSATPFPTSSRAPSVPAERSLRQTPRSPHRDSASTISPAIFHPYRSAISEAAEAALVDAAQLLTLMDTLVGALAEAEAECAIPADSLAAITRTLRLLAKRACDGIEAMQPAVQAAWQAELDAWQDMDRGTAAEGGADPAQRHA
ncbi:hypothetical protein CURE108131_19265 [Cupriavidus respiraculi]|uniref:Uncharacterized protein n=1 Tax=Cupriavidus respiraculi TaxID=195930 RepID=A0ABN7ZF22_9BURK|nr:hypothetical protein [Cupriavidus respiraculi]MBY4949531.1 hypothetical protein [Cupriavidus respiraculi]CAG9183963.1 hypothetical protein LMG21510_04989 [Cupriavidus respiraculi]